MEALPEMEAEVLSAIMPMFPHVDKDIIRKSILHPSNRGEPLNNASLLNRCIDDLLEMRTFSGIGNLDLEDQEVLRNSPQRFEELENEENSLSQSTPEDPLLDFSPNRDLQLGSRFDDNISSRDSSTGTPSPNLLHQFSAPVPDNDKRLPKPSPNTFRPISPEQNKFVAGSPEPDSPLSLDLYGPDSPKRSVEANQRQQATPSPMSVDHRNMATPSPISDGHLSLTTPSPISDVHRELATPSPIFNDQREFATRSLMSNDQRELTTPSPMSNDHRDLATPSPITNDHRELATPSPIFEPHHQLTASMLDNQRQLATPSPMSVSSNASEESNDSFIIPSWIPRTTDDTINLKTKLEDDSSIKTATVVKPSNDLVSKHDAKCFNSDNNLQDIPGFKTATEMIQSVNDSISKFDAMLSNSKAKFQKIPGFESATVARTSTDTVGNAQFSNAKTELKDIPYFKYAKVLRKDTVSNAQFSNAKTELKDIPDFKTVPVLRNDSVSDAQFFNSKTKLQDDSGIGSATTSPSIDLDKTPLNTSVIDLFSSPESAAKDSAPSNNSQIIDLTSSPERSPSWPERTPSLPVKSPTVKETFHFGGLTDEMAESMTASQIEEALLLAEIASLPSEPSSIVANSASVPDTVPSPTPVSTTAKKQDSDFVFNSKNSSTVKTSFAPSLTKQSAPSLTKHSAPLLTKQSVSISEHSAPSTTPCACTNCKNKPSNSTHHKLPSMSGRGEVFNGNLSAMPGRKSAAPATVSRPPPSPPPGSRTSDVSVTSKNLADKNVLKGGLVANSTAKWAVNVAQSKLDTTKSKLNQHKDTEFQFIEKRVTFKDARTSLIEGLDKYRAPSSKSAGVKTGVSSTDTGGREALKHEKDDLKRRLQLAKEMRRNMKSGIPINPAERDLALEREALKRRLQLVKEMRKNMKNRQQQQNQQQPNMHQQQRQQQQERIQQQTYRNQQQQQIAQNNPRIPPNPTHQNTHNQPKKPTVNNRQQMPARPIPLLPPQVVKQNVQKQVPQNQPKQPANQPQPQRPPQPQAQKPPQPQAQRPPQPQAQRPPQPQAQKPPQPQPQRLPPPQPQTPPQPQPQRPLQPQPQMPPLAQVALPPPQLPPVPHIVLPAPGEVNGLPQLVYQQQVPGLFPPAPMAVNGVQQEAPGLLDGLGVGDDFGMGVGDGFGGVPEEVIRDITNEVLNLFCDADPAWVRQRVKEFIDRGDVVSAICNFMLENEFPKKNTAETTAIAEPKKEDSLKKVNYFTDYSNTSLRSVSSQAQMQGYQLLQNDFRRLSCNTIVAAMSMFNEHYAPTKKCLEELINNNDKVKTAYNSSSRTHPSERKVIAPVTVKVNSKEIQKNLRVEVNKSLRNKFHVASSKYDPELQLEIDFFNTQVKCDAEERDRQLALELNEHEYEAEGQLIECQCCYIDTTFDDLVQCLDGHLFCQSCLRRYIQEATYGEGKAHIVCMTDGCDSTFPRSQLQKALSPSDLAKFDDRVGEESLQLADMGENLVRCPSCNYAALMADEDKVFICQTAECKKETCRYCKEDWKDHFGIPCNEIEKKSDTKTRVSYEERMTMAKIRSCHRCKAGFTKSEGCNRMTCRCGAKMCYICRKPNIDYNHFCRHVRDPGHGCKQCSACSLWSNPEEDDERAIQEIRKQMEDEKKTTEKRASTSEQNGPNAKKQRTE